MKISRFSEHQIIKLLKKVEAGRTAEEVYRENHISNATYYAWKGKSGGMEPLPSNGCVNLSTKTPGSSRCSLT